MRICEKKERKNLPAERNWQHCAFVKGVRWRPLLSYPVHIEHVPTHTVLRDSISVHTSFIRQRWRCPVLVLCALPINSLTLPPPASRIQVGGRYRLVFRRSIRFIIILLRANYPYLEHRDL